ncbi:MAG: tetratricopeptide repeat protein [Candidatus Omnitrophica bacterium]|nr:tetratricopeptide repeat protein [Candidatus Omnitrophota bacterium]
MHSLRLQGLSCSWSIMHYRRHIRLIILAGLIVYLNSLKNGFVWDDVFVVINHDFIKGYKLIHQIFLKPFFYFARPEYLYYRPVVSLSYALDYTLWGLNPFGFHLTNVLLHICAALLIYRLIDLLYDDRSLSFFSGLIFTVHPINTSVVNYVTSRADILSLLFTALSLILFFQAHSHRSYILSVVCFVLAVLSKESSIILPFCLISINEIYSREKRNISRRWYFIFIGTAIVYILFRIKILRLAADILPSGKINLLSGIFTLPVIILDYLKLLYLPFGLHMLRNINILPLAGTNIFLFLILAGFTAAVLLLIFRINKNIFLALGFFLLWLLPVASISVRNPEYYLQQRAIMEEHWLYLPSIGIFIITVYLLRRITRFLGKESYKIILLLFIVYLSIITIRENSHWRNNYSLFTHTLKYVKNSITAYKNMGWVYINRQDIPEALKMYKKALGLKQDDNSKLAMYKNISYAYFLDNQLEEARNYCLKALAIQDNDADAFGQLGLIEAKADLNKAKEDWKKAAEADPLNAAAFNNLLSLSGSDKNIRQYLLDKYGSLLNKYKNFQQYKIYRALGLIYLYNNEPGLASAALKKAYQVNPYDVKINNALAVYYAQSGDFRQAVKFFKTALRLNPFEKETYLNFANLYEQWGNLKEAERLREKASTVNLFN